MRFAEAAEPERAAESRESGRRPSFVSVHEARKRNLVEQWRGGGGLYVGVEAELSIVIVGMVDDGST
jgi:hypothetical protein